MVKHFLFFISFWFYSPSSPCSSAPIAQCLTTLFPSELSSDPTIRSHLAALYDTLLEQNLLRIVEPYSVVEIAYVAETVGQERQAVEAKCVTRSLVVVLSILSLTLDYEDYRR